MLHVLPPTSQSCFATIRFLQVVSSCCSKQRVVLLFATKSVQVARFTGPRQTFMARLPRYFIQSEVSIHATCNNLVCCKTGLKVGGKTCNSVFQNGSRQCCKTSCTFLLPDLAQLKSRLNKINLSKTLSKYLNNNSRRLAVSLDDHRFLGDHVCSY